MNAKRRTRVAKMHEELDAIQGYLRDLLEEAQELKEQEREAFDNLPPGLQQSERGQNMEAHADRQEEAADGIEQALDTLDEAYSTIQDTLDND